jgi:hypothetical protein
VPPQLPRGTVVGPYVSLVSFDAEYHDQVCETLVEHSNPKNCPIPCPIPGRFLPRSNPLPSSTRALVPAAGSYLDSLARMQLKTLVLSPWYMWCISKGYTCRFLFNPAYVCI